MTHIFQIKNALNNASVTGASVCIPRTAMSQGSVVSDVLVQVPSSSGMTGQQTGQVLTNSLAGLSGTLGSGLSSQSIAGILFDNNLLR